MAYFACRNQQGSSSFDPPRGGAVYAAGLAYLWSRLQCSGLFGVLRRFQVHYNGYLKPFQEPWCYGADVERICKRFILLRYELIQLWYSPLLSSCCPAWPCSPWRMPLGSCSAADR